LNTRTYHMYFSGAIPGVPGPNRGLWPGGQSVVVDEDTNQAIATYPIGKPLDAEPAVEVVEAQVEHIEEAE